MAKRALILIQIILSLLVIVAVSVEFKTAFWLHSMGYNDPVRKEWEPILDPLLDVLWFGSIGTWIAFTIFHWTIAVSRKSGPKIDA
jgi:hypothetical protein